jgi:cyclophilin family peptidyl-prolyl cis-trans isomerase/HEAT repeat protein
MRLRLVTSCLLLAGSTANLGAQRAPLKPSDTDVTLYARLLAMADTRNADTALATRALSSGWAPLRAFAALYLGQVGRAYGAEITKMLVPLLHDADANVAAKAAYSLGLRVDTAALNDLSKALSYDPRVAREAAWALGEIGSSARRAITLALHERHEDGTTIQLLLAAAKLRPVQLIDVRPFFSNPNSSIVWAAAYAVARQRSPAGVRDLLALQESINPPTSANVKSTTRAPYDTPDNASALIRAEIARGLARTAAGDSLGERAFAGLTKLVSDRDAHVRINAVRSLGTYGAKAKSALITAARDQDPNVRVAVAQSLSSALARSDNDFEKLWAADTSVVYRSSLLASATRAGLRPRQLGRWASSGDWHLRAAVASASGDSSDRAFALSRAIPLTRDVDPRVREAAFAEISPPASMQLEDSVHALLLKGLQDPDFYVRATVLAALAERPSAADLRPVMASFQLARRDSANDARLAVIQYLGALWKKDSSIFSSTLVAEIRDRIRPLDPVERSAAAIIPFWKGYAMTASVPRPAGWYQNVVRSIVLPSLEGKRPRATIQTVRGPIELELFGDDAPITAWNFLTLARSGYYRNTRFHRVVPNFVAQDGDPRDDGNGGPGYAIRDEMNPNRYERGAVGMALSGPDTGGSQYFITHSPQPHLDGHYTVFGRVVRGYDVLDKIVQGDLIMRVDAK